MFSLIEIVKSSGSVIGQLLFFAPAQSLNNFEKPSDAKADYVWLTRIHPRKSRKGITGLDNYGLAGGSLVRQWSSQIDGEDVSVLYLFRQ